MSEKNTYRDPSWGILSKMALVFLLLVFVWFTIPSSIFFRQINMAIVKDMATGHWVAISERELPFGAVSGRTQVYIQVLGRIDGQECQWNTEGLFIPRDNNVTRYDIDAWAKPCLDSGPPISVRFSRTIFLGGFIPLRPTHFSFTINPEIAPELALE